MELKEYLKLELEGLERGLKRVLDGLNQEEITWRPSSGSNSIGLILFHTARSEDSFIHARLKAEPELWVTGQWYKKLNMAENEIGSHYTIDQVNAFKPPKLADLVEYYTAVHNQTMDYLKTLTAENFDKTIDMPRRGETKVAAVFSIIVSHTSQHIGEVSYLRGLQRGMDK
jgi:uncharacterized damage-inducible protein DinB